MPAEAAETIRAFVALDLDAMSVRRVVRVADRLRMSSGAPSATWTPAAKMHVTLKFIGSLASDAAEPLGKALCTIAESTPALKPCTFRVDAFPRAREARLVIALLRDDGGAIAKIAERVDEAARKYGVEPEARRFRPHVTLARLKMPYDTRKWVHPELAENAGECTATQMTLYRSELGKEGATYTPLTTFELTSPP
jgi:2'-5' RNA ligase